MGREYHVVVERDAEGLFVATVPALKGCHTQAPTLEALEPRVREAIALCAQLGSEATGLELVDLWKVEVGA